MKNQQTLWYTNPSLKVVMVFSTAWLVSNFLIVLATTDFLKISFFKNVSLLILLIMVVSTVQTGKLIRNYLRTRTTGN